MQAGTLPFPSKPSLALNSGLSSCQWRQCTSKPSSILPVSPPGAQLSSLGHNGGRQASRRPPAQFSGEPALDGPGFHHDSSLVKTSHSFRTRQTFAVDGDDHQQYTSPISIGYEYSKRALELLDNYSVSSVKTPCTSNIFDAIQTPLLVLRSPAEVSTNPSTSYFDAHADEMSITMSAPGTPPELSASKSSSDTSSTHSSSPGRVATDVTNFEDIGLEDETVKDENVSKVAGPQTAMSGQNSTQRSLPMASRPKLPGLKTRHTNLIYQKSIEGIKSAGPLKRGFTSPTMPLSHGDLKQMRPRSSSPARRPPSSFSTNNLPASLHPNTILQRQSLPAHSRRGSWQPSRKTIQELEEEYHNSDDDLPEDASLWNVPLSPFIGNPRSGRSSFTASPEREHSSCSPRPIPLSHARTAPETPPNRNGASQVHGRKRLPPPRSPSTSVVISAPSSPTTRGMLRQQRSKSWNVALAELSEEARILSENLEHHANMIRARDTVHTRSASYSQSPKTEKSPPWTTIELPPVQKGSLDFLPASKEKQSFLSRTRPSWLPPKNPKEEKKHLKEYLKMMSASREAEKKREEKLKAQRCERDNSREALNRVWDYYLDGAKDQRVQELCWSGVSPKARGRVWQQAIGNQLGVNAQTYDKALQRAKTIQGREAETLSNSEKEMLSWFVDIERDAETAFPELNLFQRAGPLRQDLIDICAAYACYRSDIGYVYGVQLVAALLLLQLSNPAEVFVLLANCLNKSVPLTFQVNDKVATAKTYDLVISMVALKYPRLHQYLFGQIEDGGLALTGEAVLEPMFRTLFANGLDIDRLCRVWDIWVFEGDRTLARVATAILGSLQPQIFDVKGDIDLKRRNIQEMLGWGPFIRTPTGSYWDLQAAGDMDHFVEEVRLAGLLNYAGR